MRLAELQLFRHIGGGGEGGTEVGERGLVEAHEIVVIAAGGGVAGSKVAGDLVLVLGEDGVFGFIGSLLLLAGDFDPGVGFGFEQTVAVGLEEGVDVVAEQREETAVKFGLVVGFFVGGGITSLGPHRLAHRHRSIRFHHRHNNKIIPAMPSRTPTYF